MKIDEPKTPYARHYDPTEDEEEMRMLDAEEIIVDELDMDKARQGRSPNKASKRAKEEEIPGLSLGDPEEDVPDSGMSDGSKKKKAVHVRADEHVGLSREEVEKHKRFEEMRKKHYEMKNVTTLLGHPEELDAMDEEEDMNGNAR